MATQNTGFEATPKVNKHQPNNASPILKLFAPDPVDPLGNVRPLRNIRDRIYAYAWSRDRRDDQKLDWVVSEWGFNRNVPERYIPGTPYGTLAFQRSNELPCNLHLANKQISQDFTRFIYTVNDLEVDVDLKAVYTEQGEAGLQNIVTLLQNPNFQKFTRTARIRIHFPYRYPVNNLPAFNHRALVDISESLDEFQQLVHLAVRIVPMQGQLLDYELRVAAFPFYPMQMTSWSIRTLNDRTFPYQWDILDGQQTRLLDKAWELYQECGSLAAPVNPAPTLQQLVSTESAPSNIATNKNGSQKKKLRKVKAAADVPFAGAAGTVDNPTTSSSTMQLRPSTPLNLQSLGTEVTVAQAALDEVVGDVTTLDAGADTNAPMMDFESDIAKSSGIQPVSLASAVSSPAPHTPAQPHIADDEATNRLSSSVWTACILTPASSSDDAETSANAAHNVDTIRTIHDMKESRYSRPPSPSPSSLTLDNESDARSTPGGSNKNDEQEHLVSQLSGNNPEQNRVKRKRKNRKPANKLDAAESAEGSSTNDMVNSNASDPGDEAKSRPVNLANYELHVISGNPRLICYNNPETGIFHIVQRNPQVDRYLRQQTRRRADAPKREAEKKQAREMRNLRKAKQLLLRRASIAANSPLSRVLEPRPESSKKKASVQVRKSDSGGDASSGDQLSGLRAILSQVQRTPNSDLGASADDPDQSKQNLALSKEVLQHGHEQSFGFNSRGLKHENEDGQEIDATVQGYIGDWAGTCHSDEDSRYYVHEDDETDHSVQELSSKSLACLDDGYGYPPPYKVEDRFSQLQDELSPRSPKSTDAEAPDSSDMRSCSAGQVEEGSNNGRKNAENVIVKHDNKDQIAHPELSGRAPTNATLDQVFDNQFPPPIELLPCPIPFSHGRAQKADISIQGAQGGHKSRRSRGQQHRSAREARRGHRGSGAQLPSAPVQDAYINKARNSWAAVVQAGDGVMQDRRREQLAELEREMKANGTDYSHHEAPIKDQWIKRDDDGNHVGGATEQVIYGARSHDTSSPGNLVTIQEGTRTRFNSD